MNQIIEIASKVSTPLALAGIIAAFLFFIFRQIISKDIFPRLTIAVSGTVIMAIINRLFALALVAMVLGFLGYVLVIFAGNDKKYSPHVNLSLPSGVTFRDATRLIADIDRRTMVFIDCAETTLNTKVEGGNLSGETSKELIEALQFRLIGTQKTIKYKVKDLKERGIYEIHCAE